MGTFQMNPFHLILKCWLLSLERPDLKQNCSNYDFLQTENVFDSVTVKWSTLNFCAALPGIFTAILNIFFTDKFQKHHILLFAIFTQISGQVTFISAFYTNSFLQACLGKVIDALSRGFYPILLPLLIQKSIVEK